MILEATLPTLLENLPCPHCLHSRFRVVPMPDPLWNHRAHCCICGHLFPLTTRTSALEQVGILLHRAAWDGAWRLEFVADLGLSGRYFLIRHENGLIRWGFLGGGCTAPEDAPFAAS